MIIRKGKRICASTGIVCLVLSIIVLVGLMGMSCSNSNNTAPSNTTPAASPVESKPIKLVFSIFEGEAATSWHFLKQYFDDVEKASGGRIQIESHLNGELVSLIDTYSSVVKGTIDLGYYFPAMDPVKFPLVDLSCVFSYDMYHTRLSRTAWELYKAFPQFAAQSSDTHLIWMGENYSLGIGTAKKPIEKFEDFKGLKVASSGKMAAAREQALGLVPTSLPPEAVVPSMQTGVIDALVCSAWHFRDLNWGSVLKYYTQTNIIADALCAVYMNQETWNKLPADVQKIFNDNLESSIDKWDELKTQIEKERMASLEQEFGVKINEFSKDDLAKMQAISASAYDSYIAELESKGFPGKEMSAKWLELQKQYSSPTNIFK